MGARGSFALGWLIGRKSEGAASRLVKSEELVKAREYLDRWGFAAITATRPLPILAETASVAAGLSGMRFGPSLLAAALGSVPEALLYALVGSAGAAAGGFWGTAGVFLGALALAAVFWAAAKVRLSKSVKHGRVSRKSEASPVTDEHFLFGWKVEREAICHTEFFPAGHKGISCLFP